MPDWCANRLTITGDKQELETLRRAVADDAQGLNLSFERIRPMPAVYEDAAAYVASPEVQTIVAELGKLGEPERAEFIRENPIVYVHDAGEQSMPGWWLWKVQNWGTKWDLDPAEVTVEVDRDRLTYEFPTAWSEPAALVQALAEQYPALRFEHVYWASYLALAGCAIYQSGLKQSRVEMSEDVADCAKLLRGHGWEDAAFDCEELAEDWMEDDDETPCPEKPAAAESGDRQLRLVADTTAAHRARPIDEESLADLASLVLKWFRIPEPWTSPAVARKTAEEMLVASDSELEEGIDVYRRCLYDPAVGVLLRVESRLSGEDFDRAAEIQEAILRLLEKELDRRNGRSREPRLCPDCTAAFGANIEHHRHESDDEVEAAYGESDDILCASCDEAMDTGGFGVDR